MKNEKVNFRINPNIVAELNNIYGSTSVSFRKAGGCLLSLRKVYLNKVKGKFTINEITAMADSLNGVIIDEWQMANNSIILAGFVDSETLDGTFKKHNADFAKFTESFQLLSQAECFFLVDEIYRFWNTPHAYGSPTPDLIKLIDSLK